MDIGLRIKELRENKNLSQEELGNLVGVSKQMISHYEAGINVPRSGKIKKIAQVFNITEEEFYTSKTISNLTNKDSEDEIKRLRNELEEVRKALDKAKDEIIDLLKKYNK